MFLIMEWLIMYMKSTEEPVYLQWNEMMLFYVSFVYIVQVMACKCMVMACKCISDGLQMY